ncbi:ComEC/Rec2 family competence protein [Microbacterium arborescens]|uniref:ComEC/Rec2 family competence protein n=1 Tax=Microbacterium arborescens TaxID=33883 RepID=UPI003C72922B
MSRSVRRRDLRLLPVAVTTWAAALLATRYPQSAALLAITLWGIAGATTFALSRVRGRGPMHGHAWRTAGRGRLRAGIGIVALAFAAAAVSHVAMSAPERERVSSLPVTGGRALTVEAEVTGKIERSALGWRFDAVATRIRAGGDDTRTRVPVAVRTSARPTGLDLGASISLAGSAFRAGPGERAVLVITGSRPPEVGHPPGGLLAVASDLRAGLLAQAASLPQPGAGLVAGLAVGDTSAVSDELDAQMTTASLSHLTAVSGANCALVVGIAFIAAGSLGLRRVWRVVIALAALTGFVVLVSPEPSVVRAAAMAAIAMLASLVGRAGAGASVLCMAVVICLIADPWLAGSLGFALSAAATAALVLVAGPVSDSLSRVMSRPLALAVAVPTVAQLACTPILVMIEPRLPLYGILANALTAPAAPLATIAGLAACLSAPVPVLASGLAVIAWLPCAWVAATAAAVDAAPMNSMPWPPGALGVVLACATCAAVLVTLLPAVPRPVRRVAASLTAVAVGITSGAALVSGPLERARTPDGWAIALCDVGQGDAVLLRSKGAVALIDTGPDTERLAACLDRFGIDSIDLLVLTHFDLDHVGGTDAVVGRVGTVLHGPVGAPEDDAMLSRLAEAGADVRAVSAGMTGSLGAATWEILWPRGADRGFAPGNDASVVVSARGGGIPATLLLGDLSETPQIALGAALRRTYDVVKVAHHGSADQSPLLYRRLGARVALIGVGENDYGHPRRETVSMLESLALEIVRTDTTGAAALTVTPDGLHVWRERPEPPSTPETLGVAGDDRAGTLRRSTRLDAQHPAT